jgi:hypothetical protein
MPIPSESGSIQQKLLVTRLISTAMATGILLFLCVIALMNRKPAAPAAESTVFMMTGIAAVIWTAGLLAGALLFQRQTAPTALASVIAGLDEEAASHAIFPRIQAAFLMRWALLEGPALFASVVLFLNHMNLRARPLLGIDLLIAAASSAIIVLTTPSEDWLRDRVRAARRSPASRP